MSDTPAGQPGGPEEVPQGATVITIASQGAHADLWLWEALYSDLTTFPEVDERGARRRFHEIDHDRLVGFVLRPLRPELPQFAVQLALGDGRRLIFLRRRGKTLLVGGDGQLVDANLPPPPIWHLLGWQRTEGRGKAAVNRKVILYISEQGDSFLSEDDNAPLGQ